MSMPDTAQIRAQFPALQQQVNGQPAIFFDGPAGTQSPQSVIDAMRDYLATSSSNLGGEFVVSQRTGQVAAAARHAMADMLNARRRKDQLRSEYDQPDICR